MWVLCWAVRRPAVAKKQKGSAPKWFGGVPLSYLKVPLYASVAENVFVRSPPPRSKRKLRPQLSPTMVARVVIQAVSPPLYGGKKYL